MFATLVPDLFNQMLTIFVVTLENLAAREKKMTINYDQQATFFHFETAASVCKCQT